MVAPGLIAVLQSGRPYRVLPGPYARTPTAEPSPGPTIVPLSNVASDTAIATRQTLNISSSVSQWLGYWTRMTQSVDSLTEGSAPYSRSPLNAPESEPLIYSSARRLHDTRLFQVSSNHL